MSVAAAYVSREREKIEVHKFSWPAAIFIPLLALFFQAFVPARVHFFEIFDIPLLVTIFFSVSRRSPVGGLLTGAAIGLVQDALTHLPIGIYGIAKTIVGYAASSLGVKIDVENPGSRLLLTLGFYVVHQAVFFMVARGLVGENLAWRWGHTALVGLANALLAVVLFAVLDKFKQRG
jgi:rod shape-determining protein MreD